MIYIKKKTISHRQSEGNYLDLNKMNKLKAS